MVAQCGLSHSLHALFLAVVLAAALFAGGLHNATATAAGPLHPVLPVPTLVLE